MVHLLTGEDIAAKDQKIAEWKDKIFSSKAASLFDYERLDGADIDAQQLKEALWAMPAVGLKRLVVLSRVHKLDTPSKKILLEFIAQNRTDVDLVVDAGGVDTNSSFLKQLMVGAQIYQTPAPPRQNVFAVTHALSNHDHVQACRILSSLFSGGEHPLQIMGGLVWFWGKLRFKLSKENFHQGLRMLQESDLNIKRSHLNAQHALELLVVKLSTIIAEDKR